MAFSQSAIADVRVRQAGPDLIVAWASSAPAGARFQVYVDRRLAWQGTSRRCRVPGPGGPPGVNTWVEVGQVGPGEATRDFSTSLSGPGGMATRAALTWQGGTYLDPTGRGDVAGFKIFAARSPGGEVDRSAPIDSVAANPGGWITDGFGLGGFGGGTFGRSACTFKWSSPPLASGTWRFAVVPHDAAGNLQGPGRTVQVTIVAAPRPPAAAPDGSRLSLAYRPVDRRATLSWQPSPT